MTTASPPPFDAWLWLQAYQQTWLAAFDPAGVGHQLRRQRLAGLIGTALRDSPFYARRSGRARSLADFEPVSKRELMAGFDDWATDRRITLEGAERVVHADHSAGGVADAWLGRYLVWTSSGTSGHPGIFVQDAASLAAFDAIDSLRLRSTGSMQPALGLWGLGRRFAYVGAIGGPYAGFVSLERLRRLVPPPWAPRIDLISVLEPMTRIAERLDALRPDVLITYPSCAMALASCPASATRRLRLSELWLGGEQLSPAQRSLLRAAFGCEVRNSYGASEFYAIAFECSHGRLHLNDDWVILEGIDAQGQPVPAGTFSHTTLLTNLANRVQPLLRYELTDRVRFVGERCACGCGFPLIEVEGRSDDVLTLPGRGAGAVTILPLVLETVIEGEARVTQFQLLRRRDGSLELRLPAHLVARPAAFERCRLALAAFFDRQGVKPLDVELGREEPLRQQGSGKLPRVIDQLRSAPAAPVLALARTVAAA